MCVCVCVCVWVGGWVGVASDSVLMWYQAYIQLTSVCRQEKEPNI